MYSKLYVAIKTHHYMMRTYILLIKIQRSLETNHVFIYLSFLSSSSESSLISSTARDFPVAMRRMRLTIKRNQ